MDLRQDLRQRFARLLFEVCQREPCKSEVRNGPEERAREVNESLRVLGIAYGKARFDPQKVWSGMRQFRNTSLMLGISQYRFVSTIPMLLAGKPASQNPGCSGPLRGGPFVE